MTHISNPFAAVWPWRIGQAAVVFRFCAGCQVVYFPYVLFQAHKRWLRKLYLWRLPLFMYVCSCLLVSVYLFLLLKSIPKIKQKQYKKDSFASNSTCCQSWWVLSLGRTVLEERAGSSWPLTSHTQSTAHTLPPQLVKKSLSFKVVTYKDFETFH